MLNTATKNCLPRYLLWKKKFTNLTILRHLKKYLGHENSEIYGRWTASLTIAVNNRHIVIYQQTQKWAVFIRKKQRRMLLKEKNAVIITSLLDVVKLDIYVIISVFSHRHRQEPQCHHQHINDNSSYTTMCQKDIIWL